MSLAETINSLPPAVHLDFQPKSCSAATIEAVKPLTHSNYVMTCADSSVNIWSTKIGLYLSAGYNFKKQAQQVKESTVLCSLYWQQFANVVDKDGVSILVRKKLQQSYQDKAKAEEEKKSEPEEAKAQTEEEKKVADSENDVYDLGGLFNEVDAEEDQVADASSDED